MKKLILLISVLVIWSCAQTTAPVVDKSTAYGKTPNVHVARDNENLFLVAMKYNLDYHKLSRINGISYPYKLYKGQRVRLGGSGSLASKPAKIVKKPVTRPSTSRPPVKRQPTKKQPTKKQPTKKPVKPPKVVDKPVIADKPIIVSKQRSVAGIKWQWPVKGSVIKTYAASSENYKGIDIKAKSGASVRAAADGVVVYVGNGLEKYGNLIIVSHKDIYLSAYAQLRKILVDEGQTVRIGEKIATLGSRPIHFEIRKDADTVDPQSLLP